MLLLLILAVSCLVTCTMDGRYCSYEREDGNTMQGLRTICSSLCYCFPQQVEVNKSCQDVDEEDFMMRPNELMKVLCIRPPRTPAMTPEETPPRTPEETPEMTPEETPARTPEETPAMIPFNTPHQTPFNTPFQTPNWTIARTRYDTPTLPLETLSANIIQPEVQFAPLYLYILVPIIVVLLIVIALLVICCRKKIEEETPVSDYSEPVIIPQNVPIPDYTITVNSEMYNEDSDPFAGDFIVSDDYFDAMETDYCRFHKKLSK